MESESFPSSFDIAGRYAKHWKQHYLRYGEQGFRVAAVTINGTTAYCKPVMQAVI